MNFRKFYSELKPPKDIYHPLRVSYDDLMIEGAAYLLFLLSAEYDDDDEIDASEDNMSTGAVCRDAALMAQAVAIQWGAKDNALGERLMFYLNTLVQREPPSPSELFTHRLLSMIDPDAKDGISLKMHAFLAVNTYVPIFHEGNLRGTQDLVRNILAHADDLLLELDG